MYIIILSSTIRNAVVLNLQSRLKRQPTSQCQCSRQFCFSSGALASTCESIKFLLSASWTSTSNSAVLSGAHEPPKPLVAHALLVLLYILFTSIFHSCSTEIAIAVLSMGLAINLTEIKLPTTTPF